MKVELIANSAFGVVPKTYSSKIKAISVGCNRRVFELFRLCTEDTLESSSISVSHFLSDGLNPKKQSVHKAAVYCVGIN